MRLSALLTVLLVSPLPAAPPPREAKKAATIDGTWEVAERHLNGNRDDGTTTIRWTINGESLVIEMRGRAGFRPVAGSTYRLVKPAGGRANEIDYVHTPPGPNVPPGVFRGRFELDGDTLTVCKAGSPGQERPAECTPAGGTDLYVFKRVKPVQTDK